MPASRLYDTWSARIRQLRSQAGKKVVHKFTWLLVGIYLSHKVHLSLIAQDTWTSAAAPISAIVIVADCWV